MTTQIIALHRNAVEFADLDLRTAKHGRRSACEGGGRLPSRLGAGVLVAAIMAGGLGTACESTMRLAGEGGDVGVDSTADVVVDAPSDAAGDEGESDSDDALPDDDADAADAMEEVDEDARTDVGEDDGGSICPVWAVAWSDGGDTADGSAAHPFVGLQHAVDGRGTCDTVVLRGGSADRPFDAGVDILVPDGGILTIEGSPAGGARAELDAHGDIGLFATGNGTLILRHVAVRNGRAPTGGCLNAQVETLWLEETEWSDCHADEAGGAVWVWASNTRVQDSTFLRNDVAARGRGGGAHVNGPTDAAQVVIEGSRFEENTATGGGGLHFAAQTRDSVVRDCAFERNRSGLPGSAVLGYLGELSDSRFEGNGPITGGDESTAVSIAGTSETRIRHNLFLDNSSGRGSAALLLVYGTASNNLFLGNACDWPAGCAAAVGAWAGEVRNNTFVDNEGGDGAAHLDCNDPLGTCSSNLFVGGSGSSGVGTAFPDRASSPPVEYSAYWEVSEPAWGPGVVVGSGNLEADPLFSDPPGDYRLGPTSGCIDAGDPDPSFDDVDGSRNDVGAFGGPDGEWTSVPEGGAP